jgi:repressor LexA
MVELTRKQQQIVDFIRGKQQEHGLSPTYQEIADHFGFRSLNSVTEHVRLLRQKGALHNEPGRARSFRVLSVLEDLRKRIVDIPVFGSIPAGFAENLEQEAIGCVSADVETLGVRPSARTFALRVKGDSMTGKHIVSGDTVVVEHGVTPKSGDVVAALIDGESTLKTYVTQRGKHFLRAENPRYPNLIPASELVIQGVMVALIRNWRAFHLALLLSGLVFPITCTLFSAC